MTAKEKKAEYNKRYYEANKEYHKIYYEANKEKVSESAKKWREANKEKDAKRGIMRKYKKWNGFAPPAEYVEVKYIINKTNNLLKQKAS